MWRSPRGWTACPRSSGGGEVASPPSGWLVLRIERGRWSRVVFPPQQVAQVKAIACELPRDQGVPLSRFSRAELHRQVIERAVCDASASTIARWLSEDAIRPWQHRSWIFPRAPRTAAILAQTLGFVNRAAFVTRPACPGPRSVAALPRDRWRPQVTHER